jgi:Icc-related predicted phosphoesterase
LKKGDVLVHCGDFTRRGSLEDVQSFADFMRAQDYQYKIVIAGNHDFSFEDHRSSQAEKILTDAGLIYLNDSGIEINGLKIWGSPVQPEFFDWAFNRKRGEDIKRHWDLIPNDTDILLTHGPPFGILDRCTHGASVGCEDLLAAVKKLGPKVHAFGHIHEDYGLKEIEGIQFINASTLDEAYLIKNCPITIEI